MSKREDEARERARELYADQLEAMGTAYSNIAHSVRSGFENMWVRPAIDALHLLVLLCPDGDADEDHQTSRP